MFEKNKHRMKCLTNKLHLALAWFTCCGQHKFIHGQDKFHQS